MIFVKNLESVSDQNWSTTDKYPGVRWKFLIDSDFTESSGLSLGFAEIAPGGDLILHYHSPAEIYVITDGTGILNKSGKLQEINTTNGIFDYSSFWYTLSVIGLVTTVFFFTQFRDETDNNE